jgi:hypothetical protein
MARPASVHTTHFNRVLSDADKAILACAGRGDISQGFKNALDCYAILWRLGYRPQDDLMDFLGVGEEVGLKPVVGDSGED